MDQEEVAGTEPNHYKDALANAKNVKLPAHSQAIYFGQGNPADYLLGHLAQGGWVCRKATELSTALRKDAGGIVGAFDEAIAIVNAAWANEPDKVPAGDDRGLAWAKTWQTDRRMGREHHG